MGLSPLKDVVIRLSLILREHLWSRTFIWDCKWLPNSKTCICAIQLTFSENIVSGQRSQKVLFFRFQNLAPADGGLTHPYVWRRRAS